MCIAFFSPVVKLVVTVVGRDGAYGRSLSYRSVTISGIGEGEQFACEPRSLSYYLKCFCHYTFFL